MDKSIIERAKVELREDDARRAQSLEQIRERLSKHPFLSNCRQGRILHNKFFMLNFNIYPICRRQFPAEISSCQKVQRRRVVFAP